MTNNDTRIIADNPNEIYGAAEMVFPSADGEIIFDDATEYVDDCGKENILYYWVGICPSCLAKYRKSINSGWIDEGSASGICSVKGCKNEADSYVDFHSGEVFFRSLT